MQRRRSSRPAAVAAVLLLAVTAYAGAVAAPVLEGVAHVIDGDTLELAGERVRLWGIDAPERSQTCRLAAQTWCCGRSAADALDRLLEGREVQCEPRSRDRYGRVVAVCTVDGSDVAATMVREGWALNYERYSEGAYRGAQQEARGKRAGLWQGQFIPPWQWRHEDQGRNLF